MGQNLAELAVVTLDLHLTDEQLNPPHKDALLAACVVLIPKKNQKLISITKQYFYF